MSQTPEPQASSSPFSNAEKNIAQTITLADTLVTLIREPVALIYKSVTKAQKLNQSLSVWQKEALAADGHRGIPLLQLEDFEKYLVDKGGIVPAASPAPGANSRTIGVLTGRAQGPNLEELPRAGAACWAYFLFALGIRPGMGVVTWRLATDGFINTQDGGIEMEIEGSVLCHIINLFSVTLDHKPWNLRPNRQPLPNRRLERRCEFPFGKLAWAAAGDSLHAHFQPETTDKLGAEKRPFGSNARIGMSMNLEGDTIMALYFTALVHGVSHSEYQLASADTTLRERITKVTTAFDLMLKRSFLSKEPLPLISYDWFENAARVKRRALAQGGHDHSFYEDACRTIDNESSLVYDDFRQSLKQRVRELFLLDDETFTFFMPSPFDVNVDSLSGLIERLGVTPMSVLEETLLEYRHQPRGSWKRDLFDMKNEVLGILKIPGDLNMLAYSGFQLLEFTPRCDLWGEKVFLGAPVSAWAGSGRGGGGG